MGKRCCQTFYVVIIIFLEFLDVIGDWLLYADISVKEKGLVYGPPEKPAIHALLAFSIIGTLCFIFEGVNLIRDERSNNAWLDPDIVSAITIWLEDVPQIAINVYIAHCREDPISVFQLTKASIVLFGLVIRIIVSFVRCQQKAVKCKGSSGMTECKKRRVCWFFIIAGLLVNSGCAIAVFIFTQGHQDTDGGIKVREPTALFEDKYDDEKYFQNVSAFINHPEFDTSSPTQATGNTANWVRLMDINDIRGRDTDVDMNYIYEKTNTHLRLAVYLKPQENNGGWQLSECYQMDVATKAIATVDESTCKGASFFTGTASRVYITFSFTPPGMLFKKLIFGDIKYNIKNGQCTELTRAPAIHYYRVNATISSNDTHHLLMEGGRPRFYPNDRVHLEDISEVWKTGFGGCESSGSLAPNFDEEIPVECSNT
ncbi:uncharacterized protein [Littorina saxatilis]|uniref:Uncharacterized protein n=1 Tax=Littorina saxatilis TaxID=31220 RepID=A0AAN9AIL9_9CAEN